MNPQLKVILLKEIKEMAGRTDYLVTIIINSIVFIGVSFLATVTSPNGYIQNLWIEMCFIVLPPFAMLLTCLPFVQEKFSNEKLIRNFEALLTTPVSLKTVWAGKIASIFFLSYSIVIIVIVTLLITWSILNGLNPISILSVPVWIVVLFISPSLPMIYAGFASWSILRFNHSKLMEILQYFAVGISVMIFLSSGKIIRSIATGHLVNWPIVVYSIIGIIIGIALVLFLIRRLDKEKVTI